MTILVGGGGGSVPMLAPDLTAPSTWGLSSSIVSIAGIDPSAGLTTVLSITGQKGYIPYLSFNSMISENYTIKLTVDGEVIWNDVWTVGNTTSFVFGGISSTGLNADVCGFNDSFLLEIQSTTDTSIGCGYIYRPTL